MTFVRNAWYCAGWSADLTDKPAGIRMLGEELVLFRRASGAVAAIEGICPHRFAPLSRGRVIGETIECGYHGLQFDGAGACTHNPHGKGIIPPRSHLKHYRVEEQSGAIWVWMGDPALADPSKILSFDFLTDADHWVGGTGYLKVKVGYELINDNLLDLTHAAYIHPGTVGIDPEALDEAQTEHHFRAEGDVIFDLLKTHRIPPPPSFASWCGMAKGTIAADTQLHLPSNHHLDVSFADFEGKLPTAHIVNVNLLTPETETSTHYFYALARNLQLEDETLTATMSALIRMAFAEQDAPMLEACAEMMAGREFFSLSPAILETDVSAIAARRAITKMVRAESAPDVLQAALQDA